eukprot:TRINITY_DN14744_c0_g1_i2.p2 TRINITY_DN14744_c0_g1~~TRINITY_DN14744_c0_g1_i2.p2  ORF type:complete len:260 (+),score=31.30 TRINITY_DN14744_c0_g1_i2:95-781(+)
MCIRDRHGTSLGGCDICGANLKRFWCQFTCSPNQSDFVVAMKTIQTPSPVQPGTMLTALNTTVTMNSNTVCDLYNSCNKTQYVTQVAAMQTASGFINFQGSQAVTIGKALINVNYSTDPKKSLTLELLKCNETFPSGEDPSGYPIRRACTCNNCDLACTSVNMDTINTKISTMKGFNLSLILIIYIGVLLFGMLLIILRYVRKMNKRKIALSESHFEEESNFLRDKAE